mmetsp:Transcript_21501/g.46737  ORF Transcript_21501/g.46737 Transcript_21501/m.46737 type:complete len:96 (-) Transcript_21501:736-1023(-)
MEALTIIGSLSQLKTFRWPCLDRRRLAKMTPFRIPRVRNQRFQSSNENRNPTTPPSLTSWWYLCETILHIIMAPPTSIDTTAIWPNTRRAHAWTH